MFDLKAKLTNSKTKFAFTVTIIVLLSACAQTRTRLADDENRVVPVSEFETGGSWRETYEPPTQAVASKQTFRERVKKSALKSKKSSVASAR